MTESTRPRQVAEPRSLRAMADRLSDRIPPVVLWALLIVAAALLLQIVESGAVESPYMGF